MTMTNVGIGLIGCGGMGMNVARDLLAQDPRLEVRALHDPDPRSIRHALDSANPDATVYEDLDAMVNDPDIQWVMIASWNCFHKDHAVAALEAGKDVFCQKPLATTMDDALSIYRTWLNSGRMFCMGFNLRRSPHYRKLKALLNDGVIGDVVSMDFNETLDFNLGGYIFGDWRRLRENSGPFLLEKCCHDIDLANWMLDSHATRVASFGGLNFFVPENEGHVQRVGPNKEGKAAFQALDHRGITLNPFTSDKDIVDNQVSILEYANGARASFHLNASGGLVERRMYIVGSEGALRADVTTGVIEVQRIGWDTKIGSTVTVEGGGHGGGDEILAEELAASMLQGIPPTVGLEEGLTSAVACFAIDEAMTSGQVVDVQPYWQQVEALKSAAAGGA